MEQVIIQPVSAQNWEEVIKISVSEEQKNFFPSVVQSLAYAFIKPYCTESISRIGLYQ